MFGRFISPSAFVNFKSSERILVKLCKCSWCAPKGVGLI